MRKLTAKYIVNAKPGRHGDGNGLYLLVGDTGCRSWILRVMVAGRRRDIGLGGLQEYSFAHPSAVGNDTPLEQRSHLTLSEARELAVRVRNFAKAGGDPASVRKQHIVAAKKAVPTFKVAAIATHAAQSHGWSERSANAFLARLEKHAYPMLGKMPVDTIEADDVAEALKLIWTSSPASAKKVRQHIATVLDYSAAKQWRGSGAPREQVRVLTGKPKSGGNYPSMPYDKVPAYWTELEQLPITTGRLALLFLIATGARSTEVREARWRHIDWMRAEWKRPAELMRKSEKEHIVTLNQPALAILARAATISNSGDPDAIIFPNRNDDPLSDMTISKIMRDGDLPWVPHGFRSSLRTWAAEQQPFIPDTVAEAALSHVIPDAVEKAYNRATFLEMRRMLLDQWGAYISGRPWTVVQPRPLSLTAS